MYSAAQAQTQVVIPPGLERTEEGVLIFQMKLVVVVVVIGPTWSHVCYSLCLDSS